MTAVSDPIDTPEATAEIPKKRGGGPKTAAGKTSSSLKKASPSQLGCTHFS